MEDTFLCVTCSKEKVIKEFNRDARIKRGHTPECRSCKNERNRFYYHSTEGKNNRLKKQSNRRWRYSRYGLTIEDYNEMLKRQDYKCAICNTSTLPRTNFDIDHCHATDRVRGLLCGKCNRGLGMFQDSIENLLSAVSYLKGDQDG